MDFRWKNYGGNLPNVQPNFVDPQNTQATAANPQAPFQPGGPSQSPQDFLTGVVNQADRTEKLAELQELKEKLVAIDAEIAKVKASPMSRETETAVAAKLAEIGDTSAYQAILARQQNQADQNQAGAAAIDNMLYEAEKLTWGLKSKNAEDREIVRSNIGATLRRAEDAARKQGVDLSKNESYRRLKAAMAEGDEASNVYEGEEKFANTIWSKSHAGNLHDADIEEAKEWIEEHPDSQFASKVIQVVQEYATKTTESKARAAARKKDARSAALVLMDLPLDEQLRRWSNMPASERKLLNDHGYIMDPNMGITSKDGI